MKLLIPSGQPTADAMRRTTGIATESPSLVGYTAAQEREIQEKPAYTRHRQPLQNAAGEFLFKPEDDGDLTSGRFGIDSFGRFVELP